MTPNYFVFCEGETEIAYVDILRSYYRLPIHIIAKKTLQNITAALIERCETAYVRTDMDHTYLMYDLDVATMLDRLKKIPEATLLCSNPCFELWLLLHYTEQKSELNSQECVGKLSTYIKNYKKGLISSEDRKDLITNVLSAAARAERLVEYKNPSCTVSRLIRDLQKLKEGQA